MPHCVIEYSRSLEMVIKFDALMDSIHQGMVDSELFEENTIKIRALPYDHFRVAAGVEDGMRFMHVTARILSGRTGAQKQRLSRGLLACLERFNLDNVSISVEVVDMDRDVYAKSIVY